MRVGVDIDDVLFPWRSQRPTWQDVTGPRLNMSLYEGLPYPDVREQLGRLRSAGHSVHLVTARSHEGGPHSAAIQAATKRWLRLHDVPHDSLHFTRNKASIQTDVFIDDDPGNCRLLSVAGVDAYLLAQPWNGGGHGLQRLDSLAEFVDVIMAR